MFKLVVVAQDARKNTLRIASLKELKLENKTIEGSSGFKYTLGKVIKSSMKKSTSLKSLARITVSSKISRTEITKVEKVLNAAYLTVAKGRP